MKVIIIGGDPTATIPSAPDTFASKLVETLNLNGIDANLLGFFHSSTNLNVVQFPFIPIVNGCKIKSHPGYEILLNLIIKGNKIIKKNAILHFHSTYYLPFLFFHREEAKVWTLHTNTHEFMMHRKGIFFDKVFTFMERIILRSPEKYGLKKIITVSERLKKDYINRFPNIIDIISVIPVGIDLKMFKPMNKKDVREKIGFKKNEKIALYVGRLSVEKDLPLLLRAFRKVENERKDVKLLICGVGNEKVRLEKLSKELNINKINFLGFIQNDSLPEIINCVDVFVMTSLFEGMPTTVFESLACGIPVVSTDVGDVGQIVKDGVNGYIVKNRNPLNIKEKILQAIENSASFRESCVESARKYSMENIAKRHAEVYDEVLKET